MALRTPPSYLQQGSHTAENDRLGQQALVTTSGIIGTGSLAVSQSATPALSISVAQGWAGVVGTTQSNMGTYIATNDAAQTLTISTPDATNPRIDRVVLTINDAYYTGVLNNVTFTVLTGTPAGSPVAPTLPANSISLATIAVAANASTIVNANITDTRVYASSNLIAHGFSLSAGTATRAPITLTAGPALTTQTAGSLEYDGTVAYFTPSTGAANTNNGGRGTIATSHIYQLTSAKSLTGGLTSLQVGFGQIYLANSTTYDVDGILRFQYTVGTPNVALNLQITSLGSVNAMNLLIDSMNNTTGFTTAGTMSSAMLTALNTNIGVSTGASAATFYVTVRVRGTMRVSTGGLFGFGVTFGATGYSSATTVSDSFMKFTPLTTSTTNAVGAWI